MLRKKDYEKKHWKKITNFLIVNYFQLAELECRVGDAESRAESAELQVRFPHFPFFVHSGEIIYFHFHFFIFSLSLFLFNSFWWDFLLSLFIFIHLGEISYFHLHFFLLVHSCEISYFHFRFFLLIILVRFLIWAFIFFSFIFHSSHVSVFHLPPHETVFPDQNLKDISNGDSPYPGGRLILYFVLLTNAGLKLFAARTSPFSDCSFLANAKFTQMNNLISIYWRVD